MIFRPTAIAGVVIIDPECHRDERGFFARVACVDEFAHHGLDARFVQQSISWNPHRGTLRGLHYQRPPYGEGKLVRCTRGAILDIAVDLRKESATYGKSVHIELSEENRTAIYIPPQIAHGFQTINDSTEVLYEMTVPYAPEHSRGIRWNDPTLALAWPLPEMAIISPRDKTLPFFAQTND